MQFPPDLTASAVQPADLPALAAIENEHWRADYGEPGSATLAELQSGWEGNPDGWIVIADRDQRAVAYARYMLSGDADRPRADLAMYVLPGRRGQGVEAALIAWAERRAREAAPGAAVDLWAIATNRAAEQALEAAGYARRIAFQTMLVTLDGPPAAPDGDPLAGAAPLEIRPFVAGRDDRAAYEADEEASLDKGYGQPKTYEQWLRRLGAGQPIRPEHWFLAWDGPEVAAGIFCAVDPDTGRGVVHHLGVRRPWRGRGLGAALMLRVFGSLYRQGVTSVTLDVDTGSPTGAHRLYERCGMRVTGVRALYVRSVAGGINV
ncbi:MAG TPA: GNAT family N-acetyltransferase [Herpetosiphonaceae bacterium]|nr:GNAT family N-acetyltransferase [Herpetosiphonaceae bacterium]